MLDGRTERLVLEPLSLCHAEALFSALRHASVDEFLPAPDVTTLEALRERIARLGREPAPAGEIWFNFAVRRRDGTVIGRLEATSYGDYAEIAYLLGPRFQRQGFGREAVRWLVERLHAAGCADVWAAVHPSNVRSMALLTAVGFVRHTETRRALGSYDAGDAIFASVNSSFA